MELAGSVIEELSKTGVAFSEDEIDLAFDQLLDQRDDTDRVQGATASLAIALLGEWRTASEEPRLSEWDGYECLDNVDSDRAREIALQLLERAASEEDDWLRQYDAYHGHMILSGVHLIDGNLDRAVDELGAASLTAIESVDSSYLMLLKLVRAGRGDDVLEFLRTVSARLGPEDEPWGRQPARPTGSMRSTPKQD